VLDEQVALYMKYSSNRLSPWSFSFNAEHQREIATLTARWSAVFVALICGSDGIACLSQDELRRVLDDDFRPVEWIRVARRKREKYSITGSDGRQIFKVGDSEFPTKVLAQLVAGARQQ